MTAVSLQCKIKNHHPEWSNVRNGDPSNQAGENTLGSC